MPPQDSNSPRRKRIAVIAVHGVADQRPEDTANTAANLLLHMDPQGSGRYHGFKTHRLRIAHRPVRVQQDGPRVDGDPSEQCQHQFLRGQLIDYKDVDPDETYETIRNEAVRNDDAKGDREVHIYEMYWADLSRLGNSFLTFFVELYQLLFHLCTVGAKTARFARARHEQVGSWRLFSRCVHFASYFIRLPIPIANLLLLAIVALAAAGEIPATNPGVGRGVLAVPAIGLGVLIAFGLRRTVPPLAWPYVLIVFPIVLAPLFFLGSSNQGPAWVASLLLIEVWLLLLGLFFHVMKAYERRHPGAFNWGIGLALLTTVVLVGHAVESRGDVYTFCKDAAERLLIGIGWTWAIVFGSALVAWIAGALAVAHTDDDSKPSARRAVFTANLTTAITGIVMLIVNIALWGLIPALIKSFAPDKLKIIQEIADETQRHLEKKTILPGMAMVVILVGLAAAWMIWALIPAVRSEITTPAPESKSSKWIGTSLTNAFRVMTWSGFLAIGCFGGLLVVLCVINGIREAFDLAMPSLLKRDKEIANPLFLGFSGTILLFIVAPFFLKGFVVKLSAGFRQGLDVALDVINYLREHPRDSTIRAQIFARYVSLLRYVCNWKSPIDTHGYDSIVIFAHSQGTMITVDLLRFLQVERDPELSLLEAPGCIQLFTMGCPLRQLYGLRFPHLYDWARHSGKKRPTPELPDHGPDPDRLLSVGNWINAYRSGDYVGRYLWRSEEDDDVYDPDPRAVSKGRKRREFCIGGGAHTHYWDKTTRRIPEELDRLIANA
jgi:hypothetical protein